MTNRFYIPNLKQKDSKIRITDKNTIYQITKVLRLKIGETFNVFSQTDELELKIDSMQKNFIQTTVINKKSKETDTNKNITLYQALLKKDNFEWVLQKCTELGVNKIVPIVTDNTIIREISKNKMARYEKIVVEATEQCGGHKPPTISEAIKFDNIIKEISQQPGIKIIPWEGEKTTKIYNIYKSDENEYHIIIGPEGGFSTSEIKMATENNITPVSLGTRILRAETAAIATVCLILLNE
ncbi:MAG: RsmE family RNA methyltransferase [bacterium]|nr:RsmE family RNA methyltransferase [bacterium]